ncbi:MAG: hypothetical protein K5790_05885 [Nitrosopumilus sp.]|uniref:hypothetical protein n=1 Tax=Nitrosopumilus sp. TaxID=2024843 RepID=UPI00247BA246|nr:hypothetical protein [Nitrosopumilus sp.]MCV0392811.1 hypothetical protein [Nitrosopumilus sp.]
MANFTTTLKNIGKDDLSSFPDIMIFEKDMDKALWVLWVLQEKYGFDDDYFTSEQISEVLKKRKIPLSPKAVALALRKANAKSFIDKKTEEKTNYYMLMRPGKEHLELFGNDQNLKMVFIEKSTPHTARKKIEEILSQTKGEIKIVDRYYGQKSLDTIQKFGKSRTIKFLTADPGTGETQQKFSRDLIHFTREFKNVHVRKINNGKELHDRYIITGDSLILLGHGIKDIGGTESFVIFFKGSEVSDIKSMLETKFNQRWTTANTF